MKNKLKALFVLAIFMLSVVSVVADLEVPPCEVEGQMNCKTPKEVKCEEKVALIEEDQPFDESTGRLAREDITTKRMNDCLGIKPVFRAVGGSGGFYIAKGKTQFGLISKYDGKGFGVAVGNFFPNQVRRLQLNVDGNIMQLQIASKNKQVGFNKGTKAVHFKEIGAKDDLFSYEILSNLDKDTKYLLKIQVRTQEPIRATLDGKPLKINKLNVKSSNGYYYVELPSAGLLEVKRMPLSKAQ